MTSEIDITDKPEEAYFSKEGEDLKEPDWDQIEKMNE